jgi:hypothetical protein
MAVVALGRQRAELDIRGTQLVSSRQGGEGTPVKGAGARGCPAGVVVLLLLMLVLVV